MAPEWSPVPSQHGPCNASSSNVGGPDNITIQYNYIHATWGECIYIGASTSDPPGGPGNAEYVANGMTCGTNCRYWQELPDCLQHGGVMRVSWGGQGDGTDVKDGHANLRVVGNTYRTSLPCTNCGTNGPGNDGQGPLFESGTEVIRNYVEAPGHQCTPIYASWNNDTGRGGMLIANNICVNANSEGGLECRLRRLACERTFGMGHGGDLQQHGIQHRRCVHPSTTGQHNWWSNGEEQHLSLHRWRF